MDVDLDVDMRLSARMYSEYILICSRYIFHIFVKYWYHFDVTIFKFRKISEIPKNREKKESGLRKKRVWRVKRDGRTIKGGTTKSSIDKQGKLEICLCTKYY